MGLGQAYEWGVTVPPKIYFRNQVIATEVDTLQQLIKLYFLFYNLKEILKERERERYQRKTL